MLADVTAVVLSPEPMQMPDLPVRVVNFVSKFYDTAGIHEARRKSVDLVKTPWFFFLDSDDSLPSNIEDVLLECMATDSSVAYTRELIVRPDKSSWTSESHEYDQAAHVRNMMLIHHLALCKTDVARSALEVVPHGDYWIELLLYFQMAKSGAKYVDKIGYIWNKGDFGMHRIRGIVRAQINSAIWCARNLK
jgi:hypothetical protein